MTSVPEFVPQGQVLVRVPEPLTLVNIPHFVCAVEEALVWCPWLVLDMVDVRHLDGVGADALIWAGNEARRRCGDAALVGVAESVQLSPEWPRLAGLPTHSRIEALPRLPSRTEWPAPSATSPAAIPVTS
jgi:anti-anti-sigma regulatory factor